jgi:hypothetical protein
VVDRDRDRIDPLSLTSDTNKVLTWIAYGFPSGGRHDDYRWLGEQRSTTVALVVGEEMY